MHLATAFQYGYYRDELYFIAAANRLAWGYVDMPPLAAFNAWLTAPAHFHLIALRAGVALAAGATVYLSCAIAAQFGGGGTAQRLSALTVALTPAYLFLGNTLTTTSFEPLTWALTIYCVMRIAAGSDRRWWIALVAVFVFAFYAKYSILLLAGALIVSIAFTRQRSILFRPECALAACAAAAAITPNVLWQAAHGWPILEVLRGDVTGRHAFNSGVQFEFRQPLLNAGVFFVEQFVFFNPLAAPVWIAGVIALLRDRGLERVRFVGAAFLIVLLAAAALNAKGYYIAGLYTVLICAGWTALAQRLGRRTLIASSALVFASAIVFAPLTIPVLPPAAFLAYSRALHIPQPLFADEFGWQKLTGTVARFYSQLPSGQRARTAVFSDTYGGAAALEFYGPGFGLPPPISAQNNYFLWGTRGYDGSSMLAVGASQADLLRSAFRHVRLLGTFSDPYRLAAEGPTPIFLCTDPVAPFDVLFARLKWYGA